MKEITKESIEYSQEVDIFYLNKVQQENKLIIPSDYIYLLLNTDGLNFTSPFQISFDKINPLVEIDSFLNIDWLVREFQNDLQSENLSYRFKFLKIANTFSQDFLLIGNSSENQNEIHFYNFNQDSTQYICSSLFTFINEFLVI